MKQRPRLSFRAACVTRALGGRHQRRLRFRHVCSKLGAEVARLDEKILTAVWQRHGNDRATQRAAREHPRQSEAGFSCIRCEPGHVDRQKIGGILSTSHGLQTQARTRDQWNRSAGTLAKVAETAKAAGVTLNLEIVNRFESNLLNTASQGLAFIADTGSDNIFLHLDTFHMNIEEADVGLAIAMPLTSRGELDDAAAAMLAQVLEVQGATVAKASFVDMEPAGIRRLELETIDTIVVGFLNRDSLKHARFLVRRLKRAKAGLRIGIVFWSDVEQGDAGQEGQVLAADISADFVAHGMVNAVLGALSPAPAVPLKVVSKRRDRRRPAPRKRVPAQATAATA
jgi:xylose isomerase-like TIM barrel protein